MILGVDHVAICHGVQLELIEIHDEAERAARLGNAPLRVEHVAFRVADAGRVAFFASPGDDGPPPYQLVERT